MNLIKSKHDVISNDKIDLTTDTITVEHSLFTRRPFDEHKPLSIMEEMYKDVAKQNGLIYENIRHFNKLPDIIENSLNYN